ncbi:MAG: hypothetical protein LQ351_000562 [Letrouitia transgressa]|nr:MAG: hypothetical protein LQ351_000562 [Letrouitia transgressa]
MSVRSFKGLGWGHVWSSQNPFGVSNMACLYFSTPFREQVVNYPKRSPIESILKGPDGLPRVNSNPALLQTPTLPSPLKPRPPVTTSARNPGGPTPAQKPEDKESSEYKKKLATAKGPVLSMNYDNAATYGMEPSLFSSLKDIFESIIAHQSRIGIVSPTKFLEVLRKENEIFRSAMHQDAHEFLNLVLNEVVANVEVEAQKLEADKALVEASSESSALSDTLNSMIPSSSGSRSPGNTRWVHELFEGTLTSETKCLTCENVSQRDEAFLDLSVDLDQHSSVTSCLRKFSEEEMLCEKNKFHCDRCGGLQEAEKRMKIKRLPKILALHLKRFKYTEDLQRLQKLFHRVVYPYHLRLFNTTDDAEDPDRLYELYAVVVHIGGGPYHGHYVSIIKTQDRGWLLFDDELVEPVDKSYVRNFFGDRPGLACAYVLFYQETTVEAVKREQEAEYAVATKIPEPEKELQGLGLKTNGVFMNGIHHVRSAVSPSTDEPHQIDSLNKIATEPLLPYQSAPSEFATVPPASVPASNLPFSPSTSPTRNEVVSKKERAKEEKERKAAEKEREKADKLKWKEVETRRKDAEKRETTDGKAAMDASKYPRQDGDQPGGKENTPGALSRFRQSSKSLSKRPKFWGSKENKDYPKEEAVEAVDENAYPTNLHPEKPEKSKNRFSSLRKKTSSMIL